MHIFAVQLDRLGYLALLGNQSRRRKTEFKPAAASLKIDILLLNEGLGNYILVYMNVYVASDKDMPTQQISVPKIDSYLIFTHTRTHMHIALLHE